MFQYTQAFLNPFTWAQEAYKNYLQNSSNTVNVTSSKLTMPAAATVSDTPITINGVSAWNTNNTETVSTIAGLFQSLDQAYAYYQNLYSTLNSSVTDVEKRVRLLEHQYNSYNALVPSTSVQMQGGDMTNIDLNPLFYTYYDSLNSVPDEQVFRLKDTGCFSSIRGKGSFAGIVVIENSIGQIYETGSLANIVDGDSSTFWMGAFFSVAPIQANQNLITWLPPQYQAGFAVQLTYYTDRLVNASEIYIDPITTEPFELVSISWTPLTVTNVLNDVASGGWTTVNSTILGNSGIAGGSSLLVSGSGMASFVFSIPATSLTTSSSGLVNSGNRIQLSYSMKGLGNLNSGSRLIWLDQYGNQISSKLTQSYPTAFYSGQRIVDTFPTNAVSGIVELGIFNYAPLASAWFCQPLLLLGEQVEFVGTTITQPTTIQLPTNVLSSRFTFTLCQTNPRFEVQVKDTVPTTSNPFNSSDIDATIVGNVNSVIDNLSASTSNISSFVYRLGIAELDIRYREYLPHGTLVSNPLVATDEIRRCWINTSMSALNAADASFVIYPYNNDPNTTIDIQPFYIANQINNSNQVSQSGDILYFYSQEEYDAGWVNTSDNFYIVPTNSISENFNGTDLTGLLTLSYPFHLRKPTVQNIQTWLQTNGIWSYSFDPNASVVYGIPNTPQGQYYKTLLTTNTAPSGFTLNNFVSIQGYLPISVTVITDKFVANPDTFGKPSLSQIGQSLNEILTATTQTNTVVSTNKDYISFSSWLSSLTGAQLNTLPAAKSSMSASLPFFEDLRGYTLSEILSKYAGNNKTYFTGLLQNVYNFLLNQGQLPLNTSKSNTSTTVVTTTSYKTQYSPIIVGTNGSYFNLFWANLTTNQFLPISQSSCNLNSSAGVVTISTTPPSGFNNVVASYIYLNTSTNQSTTSSILNYVTTPGSSSTNPQILAGRSQIITRNMTDFVNGIVPTLKPPDFTQLDQGYYPVIEYYITNNGDIQFSRDFSPFGDMPATIVVQYETLNIQPRVGIVVNREGSSSTTPSIYNFSINVLENSPTLTVSS